MKLVLAEKPSVAMSLSKVIGANQRGDGYMEGNGYLVSWCVGHLVELSQPEAYDEKYARWKYDDLPILPEHWQYQVSASTKKQFGILKKLMQRKDVESLICATDAGREGELIFRLVYHQCGCKKPVERLWISSMEDSAIREGFQKLRPGTEYDALYEAALCRERADWIVGINATRLFSCLYGQTLNVGRVMTPTLAMVVMRDAAIRAFKPEPFYSAELKFRDFQAGGERMKAKADAEKLLGDAVSQNKKIKDNLKTGELHINGYEGWNGKHNSNVAIKIHYADDTFTEGEKTTDQAVVDEKNSSTTLSVSYTGTYQQKNSKDLGAQTVETQKYNQTAKAEEKTAYTSNKYYDEYKKTGEINEGIWLTGKDDDRFPGHESLKSFYDFKDAALKAEAERAEKAAKAAKADEIIGAAKAAVDAVKTAKADAESLKEQLTALLASQNYTADQVKELEGQISVAEIKLKEAEDLAKDLTDKLGIAGETLADKITELTPAPAPGEGGSTTTPGGTTTPSGTETTPGGAAATPAAAAPASAVTTVTTATAAAAPVEIAETPVALAAAATPAAVTRTAAVANAAADVDTDADADTDVTIADEETPLAADGAQESTTIADEETPLAAEAGAVENKQQEKMSWWWLLIIALLGATGEEMYRRNKKKKAEAAQKDEK